MQIKPENIVVIDFQLPPFEYCNEYLNSQISIYVIDPSYKNNLLCGLDMIKKCINSIEENNKPNQDFSYGVIEIGLNSLMNIISEKNNEKYLDKFISNYAYLAYNVNMNTIKNSIVKNKCEYLERYVNKKLNFDETLMMFNLISGKISQWKKFVPPSFKLSEHYFNLIKEE